MPVGPDATLAFLAEPGRLDGVVETIETHLSWVLLTEDRAYKLKKPVFLPYLDLRSPERRRASCHKELVLGRRTAPTVYLDVVPVVASPHGLSLGAPGGDATALDDASIVDWVLVMRRLAADAMLPEALRTRRATPQHADAVGDALATFYAATARTTWTPAEYAARMRELVQHYADRITELGVARDRLATITEPLLAIAARETPELERRVTEGRVVDAHGDLRPEHVCLEVPPVVIDPLEFDDDLRTLDVASELSFFAMECDRLDAQWFAERVIARYVAHSGDHVPAPLTAFYVGKHALARAMIALRHMPDVPVEQHAKWRARAAGYLARAATAPYSEPVTWPGRP